MAHRTTVLLTRLTRGFLFIAVLSLFVGLSACDDASDVDETPEETTLLDDETRTDETIIDILLTDQRFSHFTTAIDTADMITTLREDGPLTIFAPTNEAIEQLPDGTASQLLQNQDRLREILEYHIIENEVRSGDVADDDTIRSREGRELRFSVQNGDVSVNEAALTEMDIEAGNGIIHVINAVLLPPED